MQFTPFSPQSFRTSVPSRCDERDGGTEAAPLLGTLVCVVPEFVSSYSSLRWDRWYCSGVSVERKTSKEVEEQR